MLHSHHLLSSLSPAIPNPFLHRSARCVHFLRRFRPCNLPRAAVSPPETEVEGPIEIPESESDVSSMFSVNDDDNATPLQVVGSVLLTGAISVLLFRSLRRRAKRFKEMRVRSSGMNKIKDPKEEALERLNLIRAAKIDPGQPPSPAQAFLGSLAAGVICFFLYKFTTNIEASLNRQAISDNYSVRQITITIRTILNGICYLATFVFGINSVGLLLYSVQLAFASIFEKDSDFSNKSEINKKEGEKLVSSEGSINNVGPIGSDLNQSSDNSNNNMES